MNTSGSVYAEEGRYTALPVNPAGKSSINREECSSPEDDSDWLAWPGPEDLEGYVPPPKPRWACYRSHIRGWKLGLLLVLGVIGLVSVAVGRHLWEQYVAESNSSSSTTSSESSSTHIDFESVTAAPAIQKSTYPEKGQRKGSFNANPYASETEGLNYQTIDGFPAGKDGSLQAMTADQPRDSSTREQKFSWIRQDISRAEARLHGAQVRDILENTIENDPLLQLGQKRTYSKMIERHRDAF
eukprot:g43951.t1